MCGPSSPRTDDDLLNWIARVVTTRRALVLSVLLLVTAGLASQIPKIQVDPSVENLIASFEGDQEIVRPVTRLPMDARPQICTGR